MCNSDARELSGPSGPPPSYSAESPKSEIFRSPFSSSNRFSTAVSNQSPSIFAVQIAKEQKAATPTRFQVAMAYAVLVAVLHAVHELAKVKSSRLFAEPIGGERIAATDTLGQ